MEEGERAEEGNSHFSFACPPFVCHNLLGKRAWRHRAWRCRPKKAGDRAQRDDPVSVAPDLWQDTREQARANQTWWRPPFVRQDDGGQDVGRTSDRSFSSFCPHDPVPILLTIRCGAARCIATLHAAGPLAHRVPARWAGLRDGGPLGLSNLCYCPVPRATAEATQPIAVRPFFCRRSAQILVLATRRTAPKRFWNLSMRPAVSTNCFWPV